MAETTTPPEDPVLPTPPEEGTESEFMKRLRESGLLDLLDAQKKDRGSGQEWSDYQWEQEGLRGVLDIARLRDSAGHQRTQSDVYGRRADLASDLADDAIRRGGVEAKLVRDEAAIQAADQGRAAQAAQAAIDLAVLEKAALLKDQGSLAAASEAALAQRDAQIAQIKEQGAQAIEDVELAAERAESEAMVMAGARGTGGDAQAAQRQSREVAADRAAGRVGRITSAKLDLAEAGKEEVSARAEIAKRRMQTAVDRTKARIATQRLAREGARERETYLKGRGETRAQEIITAAGFSSQQYALAADTYTLESDIAADNARYSDFAADLGMKALIERPGPSKYRSGGGFGFLGALGSFLSGASALAGLVG